jgi:hypothetical protein
MVGNIIHRKTDNTIINKDKQWSDHCLSFFIIVLSVFLCIRLPTIIATLIPKKTENTFVKKTNNGWQHHTQKNRQYNYKKRQSMVGNLFFCVLGCRPLFVFFYNYIVCFSVY